MEASFLHSLLIYLASAVFIVPLASRFGLGSILGYLIAGLAIGPAGFKLIESPETVLHVGELGVVFLLFIIGLELNPSRLWSLKKQIFGLGLLEVLIGIIFFTLILFFLFNQTFSFSALASMGIVMSSTGLVLQLLKENNLTHTNAGTHSFSVLLFQDLAVIPLLALLPLLTSQSIQEETIKSSVWISLLKSSSAIICVFLFGRFFIRPAFRVIAKTNIREVFTAFALLIVLGTAALMEYVGLSMALGTFLAGVILANSEYRHELEIDLEPFKGLLLGLFFISVGMGIKTHLFFSAPILTTLLVLFFVFLKFCFLFILSKTFELKNEDSIFFSIALSQGGEFAFVLFNQGKILNILSAEQKDMLTLSVALSMATTPILMILGIKFFEKKFERKKKSKTDIINETNAVLLAGFGRFGQVVGRLLHSQNIPLTILESDPEQIEMLRKFGWKCYYGDASRLDLLKSAGIDSAKLLILAIDDMEKSIEIAKHVKKIFPHVKILARASTRPDAWAFMNENITAVRELLEGGLEMGDQALKELGFLPYESKKIIHKFKIHDKKALEDSAKHRNDERSLVTLAKQQREELQKIMRQETAGEAFNSDESWNTQ